MAFLGDAAARKVLGQLTEWEALLVTRRFGLEDGRPRTLDDVGREFQVDRATIREIEGKVLTLLHIARQRKPPEPPAAETT